ncbi:MAG TPA: hypothetical protein PLG06_05575, partial [Anaerolineae bacterium]|nr:hypothetical protein [Anaerolineae bacterium]
MRVPERRGLTQDFLIEQLFVHLVALDVKRSTIGSFFFATPGALTHAFTPNTCWAHWMAWASVAIWPRV